MTNKTHLARCAPLAIAATLALGSTSLSAQEVAAPPATTTTPVITLPAPAPAPAPAPLIVIPEELTQPEAAAPPVTRTAPRPATTTTQTRAAAPAPRPAAAAPAPEPAAQPAPAETAIDETAPVDEPALAVAPAPEPIAAPETVPTADEAASDNSLAIVIGALAALALLLLGVFLLRRRSASKHAAAAPRVEKPIVRQEPVPVAAALPAETAAPEFPAGIDAGEPVAIQPREHYTNRGAPFVSASTSANLSHAGASVPLPREMPASYEEREALIQRMANAAPDRANPFRSKRARIKRARLILASLGRNFTNADPWIDLSQYPSNWPELARRQSAAA